MKRFVENYRRKQETRRATAEARFQSHIQESKVSDLERARRVNAPVLADLEKYAGRIILVTNPGDNEHDTDRLHHPIAGAIHEAMPDDTNYRVSLHSLGSPNSGIGMYKGARLITDRLGKLANGQVTFKEASMLSGREGITPHAIRQALETTIFGPQMDERMAHIAVTSAIGAESVNLDYFKAIGGSAFIYQGASEAGDMRWQRIFKAPGSKDGDPHYHS
jgi:hypothetical protein